MRGIAFLPLRIRALDHLESALGIVQPHGYRTLIDEPRPYFEFPRSALCIGSRFMMSVASASDLARITTKPSPSHDFSSSVQFGPAARTARSKLEFELTTWIWLQQVVPIPARIAQDRLNSGGPVRVQNRARIIVRRRRSKARVSVLPYAVS